MKIAFSVLFLTIALCSFSQKELYSGKSFTVKQCGFNDDREGGDEKILFVTENEVVTRQPMRGGIYMFRVYGSTMELLSSKEIHKDEIGPADMDVPYMFSVSNQLYGIGTKTIADQQRNEVYLLRWNVNEFRFSNDYDLISSVEGEGFFRNFENAFLDVATSQGEEHVLISHKLPERGENLVFRLIHFDSNMELTDHNDIEFEVDRIPFFPRGSSFTSRKGIPYTYGTSGVSPFEIDNSGIVYTYGHPKKDDSQWFVCSIENNDVRYHKIPESEEWYMKSYTIRSADNRPGKWLVGRYVDDKREESGFCMFPISHERLEDPIKIVWDNQTVGDFLLERQKKIDKKTASGENFYPYSAQLVKWIYSDDGTMVLVHEANYHKVYI